jgi:hyperosmotically inducible periplasmic protein
MISKPSLQTRHNRVVSGILVATLALTGAAAVHAAGETTTEKMGKAADKVEQVTSDSWITTKVKSEIAANSLSKAFKVDVETKNGVVLLKGKLKSQDSIDLVKTIAQHVKGVESVDTSGMSVGS